MVGRCGEESAGCVKAYKNVSLPTIRLRGLMKMSDSFDWAELYEHSAVIPLISY